MTLSLWYLTRWGAGQVSALSKRTEVAHGNRVTPHPPPFRELAFVDCTNSAHIAWLRARVRACRFSEGTMQCHG